MKLSVIIATRNRAYAIPASLESVAASLANAAPLDAEIIVVDNGSKDNTTQVVAQFTSACPFPVQALHEPKAGLSRAHNLALRTASGELLAFTDDDCHMSPQYVNELLAHFSADKEPVIRGGRIELGDPTDLPLTINTSPDPAIWNRRMNSARHLPIPGQINGCNMAMQRAVVEKLGPFDERFGPGGIVPSGGDTDFLFRAYLAYITLAYVPDMAVTHYHGRKTPELGRKLLQDYLTGNGALLAKHAWKHPKSAIKEILAGGVNNCLPYFSHRDKVACSLRGALRYLTGG